MRLLCFANAGNEENLYTNEGLGPRKAPTLLAWCRSNRVEMLAVQLPGRGLRRGEACCATVQEAAAWVLAAAGHRLCADGAPFAFVGHSVGAWIAFELAAAMREAGLPLPRALLLSCFPSPALAPALRPWAARSHALGEDAFRAEAAGWDVSDQLLSDAGMWAAYSPLMRADFRLFDDFCFHRAGEPPLPVPITAFWATRDRRVTEAMVRQWGHLSSERGGVRVALPIEGHHLFVLGVGQHQKEAKDAWHAALVQQLAPVLRGGSGG